MGEVKMNQYNFVLVVCGSHSISDEVKVLSNPRIPEQKCLKAGGLGILSTTTLLQHDFWNQDKRANIEWRWKLQIKKSNKKKEMKGTH